MRAFDAMRQSRRPIDPSRMQAIEFLDSALGADRRQLIKQYVENHDTAPKLAERIWQAIYDLTQGFLVVVPDRARGGGHAEQQPALEVAGSAALRAAAALLRHRREGARVPFRALDSRRSGWTCTARICARRSSRVDRVPAMLAGAGPNATAWTAEQEYLNVLLIQQLNTGNLSPSQLDWACSQLRAWSRKLVARGRAALARGLLRRSGGPFRARAPHRQRRRAPCCATSIRRRWPSRSSARSWRCEIPKRPIPGRRRRSTSSA